MDNIYVTFVGHQVVTQQCCLPRCGRYYLCIVGTTNTEPAIHVMTDPASLDAGWLPFLKRQLGKNLLGHRTRHVREPEVTP